MKVVLDVNVLVSGFPANRGVPASILLAWSDGRFDLVTSEHVLAGAMRVWSKPYYRNRYRQREAEETVAILRAQASVVEPGADVHDVAPDEEDDLVLATAIAGRAEFLVTGDVAFRGLETYHGVTILTPREFLELIDGRTGGEMGNCKD